MRKLNQRGSFIVFLTLGFALLGTFIGFAVDFGRAYLEKARVARLIDGAALAAAKVLKGQVAFQNDATRAACDSMLMNGAQVAWTGGDTCSTTSGAPVLATVSFFDLPVTGGPPIRAVRIVGTEPVPTTFLRFLGWMAPGDYSTIMVKAQAEAGPERPIDLMLVLDRSGSMSIADGSGQPKIGALQTAVNAFLGLQGTFSANDRIGMISFSTRGCGVNGSDTTAANCTPDAALDYATSSNISTLQGKVSALNAVGGTNTMEGLRTARAPLAAAFADPARATTRKAVLLVTDGQPTFMIRDNDPACKRDPYTNNTLPSPGNGNASAPNAGPFTNGCKHGVNSSQMLRQILSNTSNSSFTTIGGSTEYLNTIRCTRSLINCVGTNGAMYEANRAPQLRVYECRLWLGRCARSPGFRNRYREGRDCAAAEHGCKCQMLVGADSKRHRHIECLNRCRGDHGGELQCPFHDERQRYPCRSRPRLAVWNRAMHRHHAAKRQSLHGRC